MVERIRNAIKNDRKRSSGSSSDTGIVKRSKSTEGKKNDFMLRRYPSGVEGLDDLSSTDEHISAINMEVKKANPREAILLPLMKSTYEFRRLFILHEHETLRTYFNNGQH